MLNRILSHTRRCVEDYDMIQAGDRIAVGVSGGKDSLTLLAALAKLAEFPALSSSNTRQVTIQGKLKSTLTVEEPRTARTVRRIPRSV